MHKRRNKPDLLFLLTVFVGLGVLLTATVTAVAGKNEQTGWQLTINADTVCHPGFDDWRPCSSWYRADQGREVSNYRAAVTLSHAQRPDLGLIGYHTRGKDELFNNISYLDYYTGGFFRPGLKQVEHFGVALQQQYRHFGLSLGVESSHGQTLDEATWVYLGISNRW